MQMGRRRCPGALVAGMRAVAGDGIGYCACLLLVSQDSTKPLCNQSHLPSPCHSAPSRSAFSCTRLHPAALHRIPQGTTWAAAAAARPKAASSCWGRRRRMRLPYRLLPGQCSRRSGMRVSVVAQMYSRDGGRVVVCGCTPCFPSSSFLAFFCCCFGLFLAHLLSATLLPLKRSTFCETAVPTHF